MVTKSKKNNEKNIALKANGTFYSKSDDVNDELFNDNKFFDAHDLVQVKYEMLRRVSKDGWSVSKTAEIFGFSRPTYYETQSDFNSQGLQGLFPKLRGPKEPHKISEEILAFIEIVLSSEDEITFQEIAQKVFQKFNISLHPRSINRALTSKNKKKRG